MKVTVCFGTTRIVVPVGDGNITVSQLTEKSLARFRKVAKKDPNENVVVHHLHSIADDGILDLDDVLSDVVDDRDVLVAVFEEETVTSTPPIPDIKHLLNQDQWLEKEDSAADSELSTDKKKNDSDYYSNLSQERDKNAWIDKWVQDTDPAATSPGYHASPADHEQRLIDIPRIHCDDDIIPPPPSHHDSPSNSPRGANRAVDHPRGTERGIDAPRNHDRGIDAPRNHERGIDGPRNHDRGIDAPRNHERGIDGPPSHHDSPNNSLRGTNRGVDHPRGTERGIDAPRNHERGIDGPRNHERGVDAPRNHDRGIHASRKQERGIDALRNAEREIDGSRNTSRNSERSIERGIDVPHDTTLENIGDANGSDTTQMERAIDAPNPTNAASAQTTSNEEVRLELEIAKETLPFGCNVQHTANRGLFIVSIESGSAADRDGRLCVGDGIIEINGVDLTVMPSVSVADVFYEMTSTAIVRLTVTRQPKRKQSNGSSSDAFGSPPSRDILEITLNKGAKGLGFTIATREYHSCPGYSPIFVKTVHRHGAAAADGRMKSNDVLLKVNGKSLVGMQQQAVVAMMKELKGEVTLTLQRRNMDQQPPSPERNTSPPPRKISPPIAPKPRALQPTTRTRITLEVPLIAPDGRPVGLGISVKGKSMSIKKEPRQDYGIFIKTILKGGAADLDGRLRADDQLLSTDSQSLKGLANKEAMQVLKQSLERCSKSTSLHLVIARKDYLNLSAEARANKHYSSFKDPAHHGIMNDSLAADPARFRAMSLSSPNLGRKKRHHVEFDSGRGVAFSEDIQNIPLAGDVLESDEDVVFVASLQEQVDPFNRDSLFRKSKKYRTEHNPINANEMKRASSHDSLARYQTQKSQDSPVIKRGLSSESIFSGRDIDPVYDTITENKTIGGSPKINDSFQSAVQNGQLGAVPPPPSHLDTPPEPDKPKSKSFLNFFTKKGNKKREDSRSSDVSNTPPVPVYTNSTRSNWDIEPGPAPPRSKHQGNTSSPHLTSSWDQHRRSDRSDQSRDVSTRSVSSRDKTADLHDNTRDHPRAPAAHRSMMSDDVNHRRSKSSDFYRDKELADRSGLGYMDHESREPRDHVRAKMSRDHSRETDRQSNRSHHSSRGEQPGHRQQYYQQPRDPPVRDPSRDHPTRDNSRDHPTREHQTRDSSRDHPRDKRYMETIGQFRYGRNPHHSSPVPHHHGSSPVPHHHGSSPVPHHHGNSPVPPPQYHDQYYHGNGNARYTGSNHSLTQRRDDRPRHGQSFTPMITTPISHFTDGDLAGSPHYSPTDTPHYNTTDKPHYSATDSRHLYDNLSNLETGTLNDLLGTTDTPSTVPAKHLQSTPNVRRALTDHRRTGSLPRRHRADKLRSRGDSPASLRDLSRDSPASASLRSRDLSRDSPASASLRSRDLSRDYEYDVAVRQRDDYPVHLPSMLDETFFRDFVPSYTYRNTTSLSISTSFDMDQHSPGSSYPKSAPYDMKKDSPIFKF